MINYSPLCVTTSSFTASVYFEIRDQTTNKLIRQFPGNVVREESHQVRLNHNNITMCSMYGIAIVESPCCKDSPNSLH